MYIENDTQSISAETIDITHTVAIHIVTYNSAATIVACLETLLQSVPPCAIHIIDNASTDNTADKVRHLGLPIHINPHNIGYGAAHNQLLAQTHTPFVLTLNPDVLVDPSYIKLLIDHMKKHPQVGMAMGRLLRINHIDDPLPCCVDSMGLYIQKNRRVRLRYEHTLPTDMNGIASIPIWGADGAAVCYRRAMLEDIAIDGEIFDELFFIHKEDIDICYRARRRGWKASLVPHAEGYHVRTFRPGKRAGLSTELRRYALRNRYVLLLKYDTLIDLCHHALPILWYEIRILLYVLLFERTSLHAFYEVWQLYPQIRTKRRILQQQQLISQTEIRAWYR